MKLRFIFRPVVGLWLTVAALVCSCGGNGGGSEGHRLMATIEPLRAVVSEVAGPEWAVGTIVPQGFSPEDYSPTAAQMAEVAEAQLLFKVGRLGFETVWLPKVQSQCPELRVVDTSEGVEEATFDPHTWMSPANIKIIATNAQRALAEADTANAPRYAERLQALCDKADQLDSAITRALARARTRTFIITHPALTHFAARYGLKQLAIEPDGKEPTPASVEALIRQARQDGARVVLVQQEFSDRTAQMIASQIGARVVSINPLSADWQGEMLSIAKIIANGE